MPSEKNMLIEGTKFPSFRKKFADYKKAAESKKFQGRDASVNSSVSTSVGERYKKSSVSSVTCLHHLGKLIECNKSVGSNIKYDENVASVTPKVYSKSVANNRSATSEGKGKFVVTKEHRKDPKKLVKDMKASFVSAPKSLRGLDLSGIDFRGLQKLELKGLDLSEVNFSECKFPDGTDFSGSELREANFVKAELIKAVFNNSDLSEASFDDVEAEGAKFIDATLVGVRIRNSNFIEANFSSANLFNARIIFTDFDDSILNKANLIEASFVGVGFHGATATLARVDRYTQFMRCEDLPDDLRH